MALKDEHIECFVMRRIQQIYSFKTFADAPFDVVHFLPPGYALCDRSPRVIDIRPLQGRYTLPNLLNFSTSHLSYLPLSALTFILFAYCPMTLT